MDRALRVLHLEDDPRDAELVSELLAGAGIDCAIARVDTREGFAAALDAGELDLILADLSLPAFDGMSALRMALQRRPEVPFIFVSGTLGEEIAIDALKLGAADYVLKERLSRIVSAVRSALREAEHRAERSCLQERLRQAETMETLGRFASGIAHDFNNVLGAIVGNAELLVADMPEESPEQRRARRLLEAALRGRELVAQILAYARSQRGKRAPTDLCAAVREALELACAAPPPSIAVAADIPDSALVVLGDTTQLEQVAMNLCRNALDAMKGDGGTLRIEVDAVEVPAARPVSHGALAPGRHARLSVTDSGCGMDRPTLDRAFEPFFTTKGKGGGTGLGLAQVHAIVTQMGGSIDVRTAPGAGSRFAVYLPLAQRSASPGAYPAGLTEIGR